MTTNGPQTTETVTSAPYGEQPVQGAQAAHRNLYVDAVVSAHGNLDLVAEAFSMLKPELLAKLLEAPPEQLASTLRVGMAIETLSVLDALKSRLESGIEEMDPYEAGRVYATLMSGLANILPAAPKTAGDSSAQAIVNIFQQYGAEDAKSKLASRLVPRAPLEVDGVAIGGSPSDDFGDDRQGSASAAVRLGPPGEADPATA